MKKWRIWGTCWIGVFGFFVPFLHFPTRLFDFVLAREEEKHVTGLAAVEFLEDAEGLVDGFVHGGRHRLLAVVDGNGEETAGDFHADRVGVEGCKGARVESSGGDDELQFRTLGKKLLAEAEENIGVDAAVVGFVEHDHIVR